MQRVTLENTDLYTIESYGNGFAYSFSYKPTGKETFLQGDDATQWREEYEAMQVAYNNPQSVWHGKSWNLCLSQLCSDYLAE